MTRIKVNIDCGKTTCERKIHRVRHFVKSMLVIDVMYYHCGLFGSYLQGHTKQIKHGSYYAHARCKEYLEAEV